MTEQHMTGIVGKALASTFLRSTIIKWRRHREEPTVKIGIIYKSNIDFQELFSTKKKKATIEVVAFYIII